MLKYPDSPHWWYAITFVVMLTFSLVTVLVYPTHLSWWAFFVALLIACVFTIPCGIIQAVTNVQLGLNVITEFIVGYIQPGRPIAMMLFKTYGYITMTQALAFLQGLKMGHYMKIPPRTLFMGQVIASVWTCFVQVAVLNWALGGAISNICEPENPSHFTCPNGRVFFNASIIWGVIGPQRMFNPGQIYGHMMWFFLAGALLPVAIYLGARMYPKSPVRYLSAPLIFGGTGAIPPATPLNYLTWATVGFIFNKFIKDRHRGWWSQYNYITSAGLDIGLAVSTIIIFFCLTLTNTSPPNWWGNNVVSSTLDFQESAVQRVLPEGQIFGPTRW